MRNFDALFADARHYRSDCRLVRTAIRRGWLDDLPDADRAALVARFDRATAERHAADPEARNARASIAESLVALELARANAAPILRTLRYAVGCGTSDRATGRPRERWHVTDHPNRIDAHAIRQRARADGIDARTLNAIHVVPAERPDDPGQRVALVVTPDARVGWRLWLLCPRCGSRRVHLYPVRAGVLCRACAGVRYGPRVR
jgi:hypothetical protein